MNTRLRRSDSVAPREWWLRRLVAKCARDAFVARKTSRIPLFDKMTRATWASPSPSCDEGVAATLPANARDIPCIPDLELLRCIGHGSYGEVWLARNILGTY